ncbi:MAG: ROK family protein, partial [Actinomycetota bacterium]|nr:ROK family protein [Actinomycetota bacterium]
MAPAPRQSAAAAPTGLAVGVDVGGTKLVAGLVAADGSILARAREDTPAGDPQAIVKLIATVARRLGDDADAG